MRKIRSFFQAQQSILTILALLAGLVAFPLQAQTVSIFAKAYDLKTKKHVYTEYITRKFANGKPVSQYTVYKDPAGKTIATKSLNFKSSPYMANFKLTDKRDGYVEGATLRGGSVQMYLKKSTADAMKKKNFPKAANAIGDDGIDFFLRDNMDKLKAGKSIAVNLAVPNRWKFFKFIAKKTGTTKRKGRPAVVISLTLSNVILRKLLPTIRFVYDSETKVLYEFQGVVILNNAEKKSHRVRTIYGPERKK